MRFNAEYGTGRIRFAVAVWFAFSKELAHSLSAFGIDAIPYFRPGRSFTLGVPLRRLGTWRRELTAGNPGAGFRGAAAKAGWTKGPNILDT
jgi:hypothetical protein